MPKRRSTRWNAARLAGKTPAGRYQLNEEPLVLLYVVEDCCHMMELKARNKDIRIVQDFEELLPRLLVALRLDPPLDDRVVGGRGGRAILEREG